MYTSSLTSPLPSPSRYLSFDNKTQGYIVQEQYVQMVHAHVARVIIHYVASVEICTLFSYLSFLKISRKM